MPSKFGNEFQVNTNTTNDQCRPSIAALSNGNLVAIWSSYLQDGSGYGVYGQLFDPNGIRIGTEFQVNNHTLDDQSTFTANDQSVLSIAGLSDGDFVAVWNSNLQDGSGYGVYGQVFNASGNWLGSEFRVNNYTTDNQIDASIAALSNGDFVAMWSSYLQDGSGYGVYGQRFHANSSKVGSEFQVATQTANGQGSSSIAALSNGNFVAMWHGYGQDGSDAGVYGRVFNATGSKVGSEFQVNTHTMGAQIFPNVAALSDGNFVAMWNDGLQDSSGYGVYGQVFNATGSKVGSEFQVNTYIAGDQFYSSIAPLSNGNFVAVWSSDGQDNLSFGVYGQVFNANASKIGNEFQVNIYISDAQAFPSIAMLRNGNFAVVWESNLQDGSGLGVYGQLFYGQLVAANYGNRTFDYSASMPAKITHLSILGALNEEAISATLTLSDPTAGNLTTGASGNVTATYNSTNGVWQAFGPLANINQLFSNIVFLPVPNYTQPLTLAVNITDGASPPAIGSFGLAPLFSGKPTKLGNEFQLNNYTIDHQSTHIQGVTALTDGKFVAVWRSDGQNSTDSEIYGQLFMPTGIKISQEFHVNTYSLNRQEYGRIAALPNGNFVVTWDSYGQNGFGVGVYGQIFDANGAKISSEFQVNNSTLNDQILSSVSALTNNHFVVVWQSYDGSGYGIYGQMFDANAIKIGSRFQVNTVTLNDQYFPQVASLINDNFVVIWSSQGQDNSADGVYGQIFSPNNTKVGAEFQVNTYTINAQQYAAVTALTNGNFVVAWYSYGQDGSDYGVYGQLFDSIGYRTSNEFQINTYTASTQLWPVVAPLLNGKFVATWDSYLQDGSVYGVYGQIFNSDGTKLGNAFSVNTYTVGTQEYSSIALLTNGNFVITWRSDGQDGSGLGVYGQLFYGQLLAANYANRTLPYIEETPSSISHLSILGALNDETVSTTLTLSDPKAGSLKTATSGNATSTYNATTGRWQAFGYLNDINQLLSTLIFLPAPDYKQNVTLAVNMTDGFSAPVLGSLTLTPIPIGQPTRLGSEFQINSYTLADQSYAVSTALANGNFAVVWTSNGQDGSGWGIYGRLFNPNGTPATSAFQINSESDNDQWLPAIAALTNDNFIVTWMSDLQDGSGQGVYGQMMNFAGNKVGNEFQINNYTVNSQQNPSVVALPNDHFVVMWMSYGQDGSGWGIYGQRFDANRNKTGSEFPVNSYTINDQIADIALASFNNGNFLATWDSKEQDGSSYGVYGQLFNATNAKVGSEFQVNAYTFSNQSGSSITTLPNDNFLVAWHSTGQDGSSWGLYGRLFSPNGLPLREEFQINTYTANSQLGATITSLNNGNFVVTWQSYDQDGSDYGIYSQIFDKNGVKLGSEFKVNTYTTGAQHIGYTTTLTDGNFVVTWASNDQDGSGYGVYGQIFYGQLVAANYTNRTLTYTEDTTLPIPNISILGALNEYAINTTLTVIPASAGALTTAAFGKVNPTYISATGRWQAFGHRADMNQVLAQLAFTPVKDTNQNVTISVEFNDGASSSVTGEIALTAIPLNDAPVIVNNQLTVTKGQAVILTPADLSAQDVDTPDSSLMFTVNNVAGGRFEFMSEPGVAITSFTQQQINDSQVRFVPDGSEVKPSYEVIVSDGALSSVSSAATVNFILPNKPPIVLNPLPNEEVTVGEPFSFTIPDTTFSDPEGMPLTYSAQQKDGNALPSWLQFDTVNRFFSGTPVQAGVNTLSVFATDAGNLTTQADFSLIAENPAVPTDGVIGGVVSGLIGLGVLGGAAYAFWKKGFCQRKADDNNIPLPDRHSMARDGQAVHTPINA